LRIRKSKRASFLDHPKAFFSSPDPPTSFDNSGQRMSFPQWHTNKDNIDRSNAIVKIIAGMFKDRSETVPIIQPVNE
jgi:glucan 1,3-beta-glucosidase